MGSSDETSLLQKEVNVPKPQRSKRQKLRRVEGVSLRRDFMKTNVFVLCEHECAKSTVGSDGVVRSIFSERRQKEDEESLSSSLSFIFTTATSATVIVTRIPSLEQLPFVHGGEESGTVAANSLLSWEKEKALTLPLCGVAGMPIIGTVLLPPLLLTIPLLPLVIIIAVIVVDQQLLSSSASLLFIASYSADSLPQKPQTSQRSIPDYAKYNGYFDHFVAVCSSWSIANNKFLPIAVNLHTAMVVSAKLCSALFFNELNVNVNFSFVKILVPEMGQLL